MATSFMSIRPVAARKVNSLELAARVVGVEGWRRRGDPEPHHRRRAALRFRYDEALDARDQATLDARLLGGDLCLDDLAVPVRDDPDLRVARPLRVVTALRDEA